MLRPPEFGEDDGRDIGWGVGAWLTLPPTFPLVRKPPCRLAGLAFPEFGCPKLWKPGRAVLCCVGAFTGLPPWLKLPALFPA